ncbi:MAG: beta-propeller fold lactonase family protein [Chloroflexi bacterium]|nr:beta-propeller fold lactonase family protein [Chloroflexota bacterium]
MRRTFTLALAIGGLLLATLSPATAAGSTATGAVFTLSNSPSGNRVLMWERHTDGSLHPAGSVGTGGTGTGAGLGNQGALTLSPNYRWLYAVNPGSDEISVFRVSGAHLTLEDVAPSGGDLPISITARNRRVYVLHAGGNGSINGFDRSLSGQLTPIAGSMQPLSQAAAGPAQIEFSPDLDHLVVTEKATNRITFYDVDGAGVAGPPDSRASAGQTPFGFAFTRDGTLVVSEAFGGAPDASAASSYHFRPNGNLRLDSASVPTTETAACWVAITGDGRFAYLTNTGSGSVTGYAISDDGDLTRLDGNGVTGFAGAGSSPIDADFDRKSRRLYVLLAGSNAIAIFDRADDGSLTSIGQVTGLPAGANGLAAY